VSEQAIARALQSAHAMLQRGDAAGAGRTIAALAAQHPRRPDVLHLQGMIQRSAGDLAAARRTFERAVEASGGNPEIRNTLGNLLADMGALDEADGQYAAAIAARPGYAPAWINRGQLASRRGRHAQAIEMLDKACALDPRSTLARTSLAAAHRAAGDPDKAVQILQAAVAENRGAPSLRVRLGIALRAAERAREAIAEYDAAERAGYQSPELLDNRAAAWIDLGEVEKARADYEALTLQFPAYMAGHRARARLYWEWGLDGDPFESFRRIAEAHPSEPVIWSEWLGTLLSFRQYEKAVEVEARAESAIGRTPAILFSRAIALSELGQLPQASADFETCLPAFGNEASFLSAFARHLLKNREFERAATTAERATQLAPLSQIAWAYLGTAWRLLGDPRESWLHDYERFVAQIEARPPEWDGSAAEFAETVAPALRKLHLSKVHPADQSLRHGTQTAGALFDVRDPAIQRIRQSVTAAAVDFSASLPDDPKHPFLARKAAFIDFVGSWSVRLTRHGFHINHVHEQGWLSSAYYFALPPKDPEADGHEGWLQLGAPPDELSLDLPPRRLIEPKVGTLVLFPSSMWHGTVPFTVEGERLTCAFDIIPAPAT